jgi:hypothetical protein
LRSCSARPASPSPCCATLTGIRRDSAGFTVVLEDTPGPDSEPEVPVCVDCLLDAHPRLGRGLDIALEHRGAEWRDGEWIAAPELWAE